MKLQGGQIYRTADISMYARVLSGELFVYIVPYMDDVPGKKLFLCTVAAGEDIPFLDMESYGKRWNFQFAALEKAEIDILPSGSELGELRLEFAKKAGIPLFDESAFQEEVIEKYNMVLMKEEAYVYASAQERVRSIENCRRLLRENLDISRSKDETKSEGLLANTDVLYKALRFLCVKRGYKLISMEKLKEKYPRGMDAFQIASSSGIPARRILLEPDWYGKDLGTFLGYTKEGREPVVLFRKRAAYRVYDPQTEEIKKVDVHEAEQIGAEAVMLYRSFGQEAVGMRELVEFGIKETQAANWVAILLLTILGALAALLLPISYEYLTDVLLPAEDPSLIMQFGLMIAICMVSYFCVSFVKNTAIYGNTNHIQNSVMAAVYDRLLHLPEDIIKKFDSADLAQRAIKTVEIFRDALRELFDAVFSLIFAVVFGVCMLAYDAKTGAGIILCSAVFGAISLVLCRNHVRAEKEKQSQEGMLNSLMFQYLCGIRKIRTDGMEDRALFEYLKKYTKICRLELIQHKNTTWLDMFSRLYSGMAFVILFLLYLPQAASGDIGRFVALLTVSELFVQSVIDIALAVVRADFIFPTYDRCRPILESSVENASGQSAVGKLEGAVEASNISFAYNEEEGNVLHDVSLKVEPGEFVGIVGASGCGKSTLFQILLGFEKANKGCVFYDHKDLDHINKPDLRKKLGVVLQDEALFTGSIFENISVSAPFMTREEAWKLLDEVSLKEEVEDMPMGLHTVLTESAETISGGQKQRILLARALAGKPSVLFLDEATSALDNDTQGKIMKMLENRRMTRIVIAHRVTTVKRCRRIFVMDRGRIVEEGSYDELLDKKGVFYDLAKRQLV